MPDKRLHRGPHPEDQAAFAKESLPKLSAATADLCWLLSRGYAERSAGKLVGDRFALTERQRIAMRRCACADDACQARRARELSPGQVAGALLMIDGYNVLTTVEAALAGGVVLVGRDGCYRDLASMHGSFKRVLETPVALTLIGRTLAGLGTRAALWLLDQPVSNSGRLKQLMLSLAAEHRWNWEVNLSFNPDAELARSPQIIASADSAVLDRCGRWFNLAREVVATHVPDAHVVHFAP